MVAVGTLLLASVAATSPAAHGVEKLASTFDEAYCDVDDSGECADEPTLSVELAAAPVVLDCESPFIQEMIGSCDMPKQAPPTLHIPTLHQAAGISTELRAENGHINIINAPPSVDSALPPTPARLHPITTSSPLVASRDTATIDLPPSRLDRPPRV
jgi:hypothetical protein